MPHDIEEMPNSLKGKLLLAMPMIGDPRFHKSAIYMISHDQNGAMGLMLSQFVPDMVLGELFEQIETTPVDPLAAQMPILQGGPVETTRGFLLHTADYKAAETTVIDEKFSVSGTLDALQDYAEGKGPKDMIFILGYSGWGPGQLERELKENAWLVVDPTHELIFNTDAADRWSRAMFRYGIDPVRLSDVAGHA